MSLCVLPALRVQSGFKLESPVIQNKIVVTNVLSQSTGKFVSVIYHYHESLRAFDSLHMVYDTLVRDIPTIHVKHWTSCGWSVSEAFRDHLLEILQLERVVNKENGIHITPTEIPPDVQYLFVWDVIERTRSGCSCRRAVCSVTGLEGFPHKTELRKWNIVLQLCYLNVLFKQSGVRLCQVLYICIFNLFRYLSLFVGFWLFCLIKITLSKK